MKKFPDEDSVKIYLEQKRWNGNPICPHCGSREACKNDTFLSGIIEVDEVYIGGKESNKHKSKKLKAGIGVVSKIPVLCMRERGGNFKGKVLKDTSNNTIQTELNNSIADDATLCTDEHRAYIDTKYKHMTVNHSAKQFVDGMVYTNGIESVWAVLKRGFYGTIISFPKNIYRDILMNLYIG